MKIGTTRVETFSDGVMAIIITIMVLELKVPEFSRNATGWTVLKSLKETLPHLASYTFSFLMVGIFWVNHHHMFHLLEKTDESLLLQNLLFLFCISLVPLATAYVGANPMVEESVAFYGLVMLLTTASFAFMRSYTMRKDLVHRDNDARLNQKIFKVSLRARTKSIIAAGAYLLSVPLAFVSVFFSFACFVVPPVLFFIPEGVDDERLAERIAEKNQGMSNTGKVQPDTE